MRLKPSDYLERYRVTDGALASDSSMGNNGAFLIPAVSGDARYSIIVSDQIGWEHVSVHVELPGGRTRCPRWAEMDWIKGLFWADDEWVVQYHPAKSTAVNVHPHTLHLWRAVEVEFPKPPGWMV